MSEKSLRPEYQDLQPGVERVYVVPDIEKFSRHNPYLQLLYKDLLESPASGIRLSSTSLISPGIIFKRILGEKSVFHHHWFECRDVRTFLNSLWKIGILTIYKLLGGKIIWTVHNLRPHQQKWRRINFYLRRIWAKLPHRIHVHCQSAINSVSELYGIAADRFFVISHPPYPAKLLPQADARRQLTERYPEVKPPPTASLFLMFGYIAKYKGILEVARIFKKCHPDKILLIAGSLKRQNQVYFNALKSLEGDTVIIIPKHIPESDVPLFFNAAEAVIFNYQEILESGGAALAQSYRKKIIVPNKGCPGELTGENIQKFDSLQELETLIQQLKSSHSD